MSCIKDEKLDGYGKIKKLILQAKKEKNYYNLAYLTAGMIAMINPSSNPDDKEKIYFNCPCNWEIEELEKKYEKGEPVVLRICKAQKTFHSAWSQDNDWYEIYHWDNPDGTGNFGATAPQHIADIYF